MPNPAKTLNSYPLMRKLAEPSNQAQPDPNIQRKITENSVPSARSDQFVDWQSKNQGGNYDQFRQQYLANPDNQYTGSTDGKMYQAPTKFTGDIDNDIQAEMRRLQASSPDAVYSGQNGMDALKRTATRNVFDANKNMNYDDLTSANSDAYTSSVGGASAGTNSLADRMRFIQNTGPEEFGWLSPSTYGVPRFARNLFNPSEWSNKDFDTADTTATIASGLLGGAAAPIYQAAKGVGSIYNTYQNGGYNGPDGFRFGRLGMDALRGGLNTTLSSFGASRAGGLGNVFRGMDNAATGIVRGAGNYIARPVVNTLGKGLDYAGRFINPRLASIGNSFQGTVTGVPRALGQFRMQPETGLTKYVDDLLGGTDTPGFYTKLAPAYDAIGSWVNYAGRNAGNFVSNNLSPATNAISRGLASRAPTLSGLANKSFNLGTSYIPQGAKNLARQGLNSGLVAAENFLGNNLSGFAEDRIIGAGVDKAKTKLIGQSPARQTNMQLAQNTRQPQPQAASNMPLAKPFNSRRI